MINQEQLIDLLLEMNEKVTTLVERSDNQKVLCSQMRERMERLEGKAKQNSKDIQALQAERKQEQGYRKLILSLLVGIGGLVTWGLNIGDKMRELFLK